MKQTPSKPLPLRDELSTDRPCALHCVRPVSHPWGADWQKLEDTGVFATLPGEAERVEAAANGVPAEQAEQAPAATAPATALAPAPAPTLAQLRAAEAPIWGDIGRQGGDNTEPGKTTVTTWFSKARAEEDEAQGTQAMRSADASAPAMRARRDNKGGQEDEAWSREAAKVAEEADFR